MSFGNVPRDSSVKNSSAISGTVAGKATFVEMSTAGKVIFRNLNDNPSPAGSLVVDDFGQLGLGPAGGFLRLRYRGPSLQVNRDERVGWVTVPSFTPIIAPQGPVLVGSNQDLTIYGSSPCLSKDGNYLAIAGVATNSSLRVWNFERVAGVWSESGAGITISSSGGSVGIASVAMSSDASTIAVCLNTGPGAIYTYTRFQAPGTGSTTWIQQGPVLEGIEPNSQLGKCVSLSADGKYMASGAPGEQDLDGKVYLFGQVSGVWLLLTKLSQTVSEYLPQTAFGLAVALVQNPVSGIITVAVGSANYAPIVGTGAAWLFTNATGPFVGQIVFGTGDITGPVTKFGYSVCLSGDGTTAYSSAVGVNARVTYKFSLGLPNTWNQTGIFLPGVGYIPPGPGVSFGVSNSVSADNTVLAIGALGQAVYVYDSSGTEDGAGRTPTILDVSFAQNMVVSRDGDTMAVSSTAGVSVFITSITQ